MTETNSSTFSSPDCTNLNVYNGISGGQLELFTRNLPKRPYAVDQLGDRLHWRTMWGPEHRYTLDELAEYLPGLEKHIPRKRPELVGLGRNVDCFDWLRKYAYREVRLWYAKREQGIYVAWLTHLYHRALNFTANEHPTPHHREVHRRLVSSFRHE